jgi:hypothetical protein
MLAGRRESALIAAGVAALAVLASWVYAAASEEADTRGYKLAPPRSVGEYKEPLRLVITWETVEEILGDSAPGSARDGGDATVCGGTGGQIDQ